MAAILQTTHSFQMHFRERKILYFDSNFTEVFFPTGLINNKPALVQMMAWRRTGLEPNNDDPIHRRIYAVLKGDYLGIT